MNGLHTPIATTVRGFSHSSAERESDIIRPTSVVRVSACAFIVRFLFSSLLNYSTCFPMVNRRGAEYAIFTEPFPL